ncbi:MAG: tRNA pseudouridine(38-40) synthase TruA [Anaerolineae bacterium]|nr:MAG: tRNA pseudouridine(38-40) synthase TruA [Anaerolineae bacterium]
MARYQIILAYDGTGFNGLQRQTRGRTVQGEVESALRRLGWDGRSILSAGRTDAGVHASGQVFALDYEWRHSPEDLQGALNALLPPDVAVRDLQEAPPKFHPRYDALARRYAYRLFCQPLRDPLRERYAWRVWPPVKLKPLQQAARALKGSHDFAAFGSPLQKGGTTVRNVVRAEWEQAEDAYTFHFEANAFLYHMVRRTVRLLVQVGQGRRPPKTVKDLLDRPQNGPVQGLAPAHGLELVEVRYPAQDETKES